MGIATDWGIDGAEGFRIKFVQRCRSSFVPGEDGGVEIQPG
jgi:hypothetical protein